MIAEAPTCAKSALSSVTRLPFLKNQSLPRGHGASGANDVGLKLGSGIQQPLGMEDTMKKVLLATIGSVALMGMAVPAFAADMAVKARPTPAVVPIYDWTGFYIGANGGWGRSHNCWDFVTLAGPVFSDGCRDRSGGVLGGQIGYRWQSNQFVFGLEAQGDWADLSNRRV